MKIRDGDPLEIYTAGDGEVIFKKYSPIGELSSVAVQYAEAMTKHTSCPVIICDRDRCIAASGVPKREVVEHKLSLKLEEAIAKRTPFIAEKGSDSPEAVEGCERKASAVLPIIGQGDILGAVVLLSADSGELPNATDLSLAHVAASFLGKQMED